MILQIYLDESGRIRPDDPSKGDLSPVVCGYIDTPENWKRFCKDWKGTLSDYGADYFHFREFATPKLYEKPGNAYYGWSKKKRHEFLYDLAYLCSKSGVAEGTLFDVRGHISSKSTDDPIETSVVNLFKSFQMGMDSKWPGFDGKVLFVFDKCDDKDWTVPINKVHARFSALDPRIGGLAFEDDKDYLPLQAADLLAYSFHQNAKRFVDNNKTIPPLRSLDFILNRSSNPGLRNLDNSYWRAVIDCIREDERQFMKQFPDQKYNPEKQFDLKKYAARFRQQIRL